MILMWHGVLFFKRNFRSVHKRTIANHLFINSLLREREEVADKRQREQERERGREGEREGVRERE